MRILLEWAAFGKDDIPLCLKRKALESCMAEPMAETLTLITT